MGKTSEINVSKWNSPIDPRRFGWANADVNESILPCIRDSSLLAWEIPPSLSIHRTEWSFSCLLMVCSEVCNLDPIRVSDSVTVLWMSCLMACRAGSTRSRTAVRFSISVIIVADGTFFVTTTMTAAAEAAAAPRQAPVISGAV